MNDVNRPHERYRRKNIRFRVAIGSRSRLKFDSNGSKLVVMSLTTIKQC